MKATGRAPARAWPIDETDDRGFRERRIGHAAGEGQRQPLGDSEDVAFRVFDVLPVERDPRIIGHPDREAPRGSLPASSSRGSSEIAAVFAPAIREAGRQRLLGVEGGQGVGSATSQRRRRAAPRPRRRRPSAPAPAARRRFRGANPPGARIGSLLRRTRSISSRGRYTRSSSELV